MTAPLPILFTAFEPSGDTLASTLIAEIKQRQPDRPIYAFGGPLMQAAGAELLETTTEKAVMGLDVLGEIKTHKARLKRLEAWLQQNPIAAHVPVDSPAGNGSVCQLVRDTILSAKIVHLVAPQYWAWAPWRHKKLKPRTDHILALLPFEPDWFSARGIPCTFVGHPLLEEHPTLNPQGLPETQLPKLALLPGSRRHEIQRNAKVFTKTVDQLRASIGQIETVVALRVEDDLAFAAPLFPDDQAYVFGRTDDAILWADAVLAVSGTVTLQVAARNTPFVPVFQATRRKWFMLRMVIQTRTFTLPNLIHEHLTEGQRATPEFVPHFGDPAPLAAALKPLLTQDAAGQAQRAAFERIRHAFAQVQFRTTATETLLGLIA